MTSDISVNSTVKPRLLSGIQPSGDSLHLGNYLGALRQWVQLQAQHQAVFFIADLHSITVRQDPDVLRARTRRTAAQFIAAGIDPQQSILFVQSHVAEHTRLAWVFECLTGFGEASRMTQFKDKSAKQGSDQTTVGLFTYPVLQAADILLYNPQVVPVGEDQRQHLELSRNLAERFNSRYSETFVVPEPVIVKETAKIYDLQEPTAKMSKSAQSTSGLLELLDTPKALAKKIKSAVTDNGQEIRFDREGKPGISNLLTIYSALTEEPVAAIETRYEGKGYGHLKVDLAEIVVDHFTPFRDKVEELQADPEYLDKILAEGAERARALAEPVVAEVYEKVGFLTPRHG